MNLFRKILNAFKPSAPVPATTDETEKADKPWTQLISMSLLTKTEQGEQVLNPFQLPTLAPGVIPEKMPSNVILANDSFGQEPERLANDDGMSLPATEMYNFMNGMGGAYGISLGFRGYPFLATLAQLNEYYMPAKVIADEMTRKFIQFTVIGKSRRNDKEDKIAKIEKKFTDLRVREKFREAKLKDCLFGAAYIFKGIKDQTDDDKRQLPLDIKKENIPKGSLKYLTVIEPYWIAPYSYNSNDPTRPDFYKPNSYFIMGKKTHGSRLMRFVGHDVPDFLKPAYNFGGLSLTQLLIPFVEQWLKTRNSISDLLVSYSTPILHTAMADTLKQGHNDNGDSLFRRARLFNNLRNNRGLMMLDKDSEDFSVVTTPLGGLHELQAQSLEHMCYATRIPLVKLVGLSPTGLNASSDGEIRVFYDFIRACQISEFKPHLDDLLKMVQLDLFGEIDPDISYEFVPLYELTGKELAEVRKSDADTGVELIEAGVISADEERERLQQDPNSGYKNLEGEAPGPPEGFGNELLNKTDKDSEDDVHVGPSSGFF